MDINIEDYYRKYAPMVLRRCRYLLKNEDRAMDAMQDTFVKLLQYRERLTGSYPSSLLYRIATNTCLNIIKKESRKQEFSSDTILGAIADLDDFERRISDTDMLERIFSNEKSSTREIAVMHYLDRMTYNEISDETGLSVSGIRKRLDRLKKKGKTFMEALT
jgi:RNA polymerase sigma-70 factor (ECF subfamily)